MNIHDNPEPGRGADDLQAPQSAQQDPSLPVSVSGTQLSWLGLPQFSWSLALLGLCIFTFAIVTYRLPIGDLGIAIAGLGLVLQPGKLRISMPVGFFGAFVLWAFLASYASPYPEVARDRVVDYLKLLVIMLVIVNALRTEGQLRFYMMFFLACFILYPVRGTLMGGDTQFGRAIWNFIYGNSNDLATLSLLTLGIALGFMFARPIPMVVRAGAGISAMLLLVVILLTQSRGAFLGLLAGMGPALLWMGLKRPVRLLVTAGILALVIALVVPASVWERLAGIEKLTNKETIADADEEGSAAERFEIQKVGWRIFVDHPVFGIGLGAYPLANAMYAPQIGRKDTHNTYLNLAAEVGLPGVIIWLTCFGSVLWYAYRSRRLAGDSVTAIQQGWVERAFFAYLVAGIVGTYAKLTFPYLMLAVLWCSATLLASKPIPPTTRS